jgi:dolichol-phosphate mannosyltransferase
MKLSSKPPQPGPPLTLFSVVIPARNEEESLPLTLEDIHREFSTQGVPHEIVVVDDGSTDRTWEVLAELRSKVPTLRPLRNQDANGFGRAVTYGLRNIQGDAAVVMMADESDSPADAVRYWRLLNEGWDCVFGSRFIKGGGVFDYPRVKLSSIFR